MTFNAKEFDTKSGLPIITGYARMAEHLGAFRVVLYSHVVDNLWQGGTPAEALDRENPVKWLTDADGLKKFDKILSLYPWEYYPLPEGTERVEVELYDAEEIDGDQIDELAHKVVEWLKDGDRVLVHCQAGLNRSALVSARVLMLWKGMLPDEAIQLLREQRVEHVLCNPWFEEWVRQK